ncbi:MAG TPA: NAD(P)/FAD-dependent oxidoreductase [Aldersonia sp.]
MNAGSMKGATYDVAVVGGGAAGLSAATTLARSRRSVLVFDAGAPRNAPAAGVHNFLSRDGMAPRDLVAVARTELESYGGRVVAATAVSAQRGGNGSVGFAVQLDDGARFHARRLVVATGVRDILPDIPGLRDRWGRDVLHCPYCHGWEVRDRTIVVIGTMPMSTHQARLLRQWSDDITYVVHGAPAPTDEEREQFRARDILVVDDTVARIEIVDDAIVGVRTTGGALVACDAVAVGSRAVAESPVLDALGLERIEHPMGLHYPADAFGRTTIDGVWLAGNVMDLAAGVINAAAQGYTVGTQLNAELVTAETAAAVDQLREREGVQQ